MEMLDPMEDLKRIKSQAGLDEIFEDKTVTLQDFQDELESIPVMQKMLSLRSFTPASNGKIERKQKSLKSSQRVIIQDNFVSEERVPTAQNEKRLGTAQNEKQRSQTAAMTRQ